MNLPASFEGRERARLFCALRLPANVLASLSEWQAEHIRGGRPVPREHLHITLAFLGHRPIQELGLICEATRAAAAAAESIRFRITRYRETPRVGMLVLEEATTVAHSSALAYDLQARMEALGIPARERRPWRAHVTVVRFAKPLRLKPPLPDLGEVMPSDAAVFLSRLRPSGAEYVVVESFALGG